MDLPHGTGHPASPSSPVIGLSLHGCQESLQPVRDLVTLVTLFTHLVQELKLSTGASPGDPPDCCSGEADTWKRGATNSGFTQGSAGSRSVERCEGMVAVAVVAEAEVAEVAEAELAEAEVASGRHIRPPSCLFHYNIPCQKFLQSKTVENQETSQDK